MKRPPINAETVRQAAAMARYELSRERAEALAPVVEQVLGAMDSLDAVKLGETAPAISFNARWEE